MTGRGEFVEPGLHTWDRLRELPTTIEVGGLRYHEGLLRGRRVLTSVEFMLLRRDSYETILEFIAFTTARVPLPMVVEDEAARRRIEVQERTIDRLHERARKAEIRLAELLARINGAAAAVSQADGTAAVDVDERELGEPVG